MLLAPASARADMMPGNAKRAKHTILVEGTLPADKALLIENTWDMPTLVEPGQPTKITWKHGDGDMVLRMIDRKVAPPPRPDDGTGTRPDVLLGEAVTARARNVARRGVRCSDPFAVLTTVIPEYSPAEEFRHVLRFTIDGKTCRSEHSTQWLDAKGQPVDPGNIELPPGIGLGSFPPAPSPPPPPPAPPTPTPVLPPLPASPPAPATPAPPPPAAGCGCDTQDATRAPASLLLLGLLLTRRSRRAASTR